MAEPHTVQGATEQHEQPAPDDDSTENHEEREDIRNMPEVLRPLLSTE